MRHGIALFPVLAMGCMTTNAAVSPGVKLDPNAGAECRAHCETLGMALDAVVVMASSTGCVCTPRERSSAGERGGATAAGAVALALQADAEAARLREAEVEAQRQKLYQHEAAPPAGR